MTFRIFSIGLACSFLLPWLLIIVIPAASMQRVEAVRFNEDDDGKDEVYVPRRAGRVTDGANIYAANGCYLCHTQLIRPTYAGTDLWRPDWAGRKPTPDNPVDTRRETTVYDYDGEDFAQIGLNRTGPDLSNVGHRIERAAKAAGISPEHWVYRHLYDPRGMSKTFWSTCPSQKFLFRKVEVYGQGTEDALRAKTEDGTQILPKPEARALASYLLSLKKDDAVPYSLNYRRDKERAIEQ